MLCVHNWRKVKWRRLRNYCFYPEKNAYHVSSFYCHVHLHRTNCSWPLFLRFLLLNNNDTNSLLSTVCMTHLQTYISWIPKIVYSVITCNQISFYTISRHEIFYAHIAFWKIIERAMLSPSFTYIVYLYMCILFVSCTWHEKNNAVPVSWSIVRSNP